MDLTQDQVAAQEKALKTMQAFLKAKGPAGVCVFNYPIEGLKGLGLSEKNLRVVNAMRPRTKVDSVFPEMKNDQ